MNIVRRNRTFHIVRRVPKRYQSVEKRTQVWISLHTDSETVAQQKAPTAWAHMVDAWEALLAGATDDAEQRFAAAKELAAARGLRYLPASKVATLPRAELLERVEAVTKQSGDAAEVEARAVLGGAQEPGIKVTRALELYWTLAKENTIGKSDDQLRRWKNPRKRAIANFVNVVGDKEIAEITADDMLDFREWWSDRLEFEGLTPDAANKDLTHIGSILKTVNTMKRLGLTLPLGGLAFKDRKKGERTRPPFSEKWIAEKLLAPGAMAGMNEEARDVVYAMVNTGLRPSEIVGLLPHHIHLEGDVPYVEILPEGKQVKTDDAERVMPLVGISLEAMKRHPNGFPTYRFKDKISATVNSFLRENSLLETPKHTLYSLRHSFEDRMLGAKMDERIRRDLMGHSLGRQRYGNGGTLERVRDDLAANAY